MQGRYVMEGLGLDPEKDFEAIYTANLVEGPDRAMPAVRASLHRMTPHKWVLVDDAGDLIERRPAGFYESVGRRHRRRLRIGS